jgi:DNA-binding SARP family transcriptional activator
MARLCLALLGNFEAHLRSGMRRIPVTVATHKAEALIAYLAVRSDMRHRRDRLSELLWGDVPMVQARHSLRQTLSQVRAALRPHDYVLETAEDSVALRRECLAMDVTSLERLLRRRTPRAVALACVLYRGEFLEGFTIREDGFDTWLTGERSRMRQLAIDAFDLRVRYLLETDDTTATIHAALRLVALDPLQEWAHRVLMKCYWRRGQLAAALHQYETCASLLARELGITPEPETEQLWRELLMARTRASPRRLD